MTKKVSTLTKISSKPIGHQKASLIKKFKVPNESSLYRNQKKSLCDYGVDKICSSSSAVISG